MKQRKSECKFYQAVIESFEYKIDTKMQVYFQIYTITLLTRLQYQLNLKM